MGFSLPSFGLGFGVGALSGALAYRLYRWWAAQDEEDQFSEESRTTFAIRRGDRRYARDLIRSAQRSHLLGQRIALSDLLVEPRFIRPPLLVEPPEDDVISNVFRGVPLVHDYPQLHAHYHYPTLSIADLARNERHLLIVGAPGSGRTTALYAIALWSMGQISFDAPPDIIQTKLDAEDKELSASERAERIKKRIQTTQEARARYYSERRRTAPAAEEDKDDEKRPFLRRFAPLYVDLANLPSDFSQFGRAVDPAEPLLRALQVHVGNITSKTMVRTMYRLLSGGRALVLLDGYERLSTAEQETVLVWLQAFKEHYGRNIILLAAPSIGYRPLQELGFTPTFLRPWSHQDVSHVTDGWVNNAKTFADAERPANAFIQASKQVGRTLLPGAFTLHLVAGLRGQSVHANDTPAAWLASSVPRYAEMQSILAELARIQLDEGWFTVENLIGLAEIASAMPEVPAEIDPQAATTLIDADAQIDAFFNASTPTMPTTAPSAPPATDDAQALTQRQRQRLVQTQRRLLRDWVKRGLVARYRGGRYRFVHQTIAHYLAAQAIAAAPLEVQREKLSAPAWEGALKYMLNHEQAEVFVGDWLQGANDLLQTRLLLLSSWLRHAPAAAPWRARLLRYLGNAFVAPNQYSVLRDRVAAALVSSGDEGALVVFRKAAQTSNVHVQRLACLALGALGDSDSLRVLPTIAINSNDVDARISASLALAAIGTQEALERLEGLLTESGDADVRRAITETLASFPDFGYPILYNIIADRDTQMRRAAVWGLGRVQAEWAIGVLNDVFLNDREWYVRTAAEQVFIDRYEDDRQGINPYPSIGAVSWLVAWGVQQYNAGILPQNVGGTELLRHIYALKANDKQRILGIALAGQYATITLAPPIYELLYDRNPQVRDAAYSALAEMQTQTGLGLEAPLVVDLV